jgi:hypothetical protein
MIFCMLVGAFGFAKNIMIPEPVPEVSAPVEESKGNSTEPTAPDTISRKKKDAEPVNVYSEISENESLRKEQEVKYRLIDFLPEEDLQTSIYLMKGRKPRTGEKRTFTTSMEHALDRGDVNTTHFKKAAEGFMNAKVPMLDIISRGAGFALPPPPKKKPIQKKKDSQESVKKTKGKKTKQTTLQQSIFKQNMSQIDSTEVVKK